MSFSAAIDFSGPEVAFAVGNNTGNQVIQENYQEMSGREGAGLLNWLEKQLHTNDLTLNDIKNWTVGNGPGSFTGLRLASSLVIGLCYDQPTVKARGMSSALAMAATFDSLENGQTITVLYRGKIDDMLLITVQKNNSQNYNIIDKKIVPFNEITDETFRNPFIVTLQRDWATIEKHIPENIKSKIKLLDHIPASQLLFQETSEWDKNSLIDLEYIRPAVHVKPKPTRDLPK